MFRTVTDDGQTKCPKHVEFYSKNIFEKLARLVGFITRIYQEARSPERQNCPILGRTSEKHSYSSSV